MIHGRNLILAIGGVPIAGAKGCSVDRDTDTIEVCSPTDGAARTYIPGTTGWSASANGLYATTEKANILRNIWRQRTPVQIQYTTGNQVEHGTAILTSLQESGEVGGLMKFSIKLQGSGVLSYSYTGTAVDMTDPDAELDGLFIQCHEDGTPYGIADSEGDVLCIKQITLTEAHTLYVKCKTSDACLILDKNTGAETVQGYIEESESASGRIFHLIEPVRYVGHAHGAGTRETMFEFKLPAGTHTMTYRGDEQYEVVIS